MKKFLTIGDLALRSTTKVQTIRFYEQEGLMPAPPRSSGGQRRYDEQHAKRLGFIRHARELGFPLDAVRELLRLSDQPDQSCESVDLVAREVLADVEAKIERLLALQTELRRMLRRGRHGKIGECRIIEVLADHSHSSCLSPNHNVGT